MEKENKNLERIKSIEKNLSTIKNVFYLSIFLAIVFLFFVLFLEDHIFSWLGLVLYCLCTLFAGLGYIIIKNTLETCKSVMKISEEKENG